MTDWLKDTLIDLHAKGGSAEFLVASAVASLILCFLLIPRTTDMMVDAAAGLAGKHLGSKERTLVINCSTNNPELFSMFLSFAIFRLGGIANPLGSNFANIYLMFLVAPIFAAIAFLFRGRGIGELVGLVGRERALVCWHFLMAAMLFLGSSVAYYLLTGVDQFQLFEGEVHEPTTGSLAGAAGLAVLLLVVFFVFERRLRKRRPEVFEDIDNSDEVASWKVFLTGTAGLILCCYAMNSLFVAWSEIYGGRLALLMGPAIFAGLHYFVGSLVTSLPEMRVAVKNLLRVKAPDLNTALGSASYSNMSNLAIAAIGSLVAAALLSLGVELTL